MKTCNIKAKINEGLLDSTLTDLCSVSPAKLEVERARYCAAADAFNSVYGDMDGVRLFSVGGRSEISGNHTDHNYGRVIAASVNLDILAVAAPTYEELYASRAKASPRTLLPKESALSLTRASSLPLRLSSQVCRRHSLTQDIRSAASMHTPPPTYLRAPVSLHPPLLRLWWVTSLTTSTTTARFPTLRSLRWLSMPRTSISVSPAVLWTRRHAP